MELAHHALRTRRAVGREGPIPSAIQSLANPEDKSQIAMSYEDGRGGHEPPRENLPDSIFKCDMIPEQSSSQTHCCCTNNQLEESVMEETQKLRKEY